MNIDVILYAEEASGERVQHKNVVVIDVFRATTVIITALKNGAKRVIPVTGVNDAFELKKRLSENGDNPVLGGERQGVIIEGFDKGNSPSSYANNTIKGKTIIFTTTNGTKAINNSRSAASIYVGAFINMKAVCDKISDMGKDIVLVCAGREGRFTLEDFLCAGAMISYISTKIEDIKLSDVARVALEQYEHNKQELKNTLSVTTHYNFMLSLGLDDDIDDCLQENSCDIVPYLDSGYNIVIQQKF